MVKNLLCSPPTVDTRTEAGGEVWVVTDFSPEKFVWLDLSFLCRGLWRGQRVRESGGLRQSEEGEKLLAGFAEGKGGAVMLTLVAILTILSGKGLINCQKGVASVQLDQVDLVEEIITLNK